jgi:hypothetical protein
MLISVSMRRPMQNESAAPEERRRWTEDRVARALLELDRRGVPISQRGLIEAGERQLVQVINYFGGFRRARRAAGLPPPALQWQRCELQAADVLAEIQRRHAEDEPLAWSQIPPALQYAGPRWYGSWRLAITAAGLDYDRIRLTREYTQATLIEAVRTLAREQPQMTLSQLGRHSMASTLRERFGSLEKAALGAGCVDWPVRHRRTKREPKPKPKPPR